MSLTNTLSFRRHASNTRRLRWLRGVRLSLVWILATLTVACATELRDLSTVAPYSGMIGHTYRVVGDVDAYGVRKHNSDEQAAHIVLIPRYPGVAGPEVAFIRPLPRGQTFRIVGAWIRDTAIDDTRFYVVELRENSVLPMVPVQLSLHGGNESTNGELNPQYYERVK